MIAETRVFPLHSSHQFIRLFCPFVKLAVCKAATFSTTDIPPLMQRNLNVTNLILPEMRQVSYKSHLQEQPCFFSTGTLHARHIHTHFKFCDKSFLPLHAPNDLMITKIIFDWYFLTKAGRGFCFGSLQVSCLTLHLCHHAAKLCLALRCATRVFLQHGHTMAGVQILHVAGYPIYQEELWADCFGHLTPAELSGTLALRCLDQHAISEDVVKASTPFTLTSYQ